MQGREVQDVVTALLYAAIEASHAVDRLHQLALVYADTDPVAAADVADAIAAMSEVRATMIRDADNLTALMAAL